MLNLLELLFAGHLGHFKQPFPQFFKNWILSHVSYKSDKISGHNYFLTIVNNECWSNSKICHAFETI